MDLSGRERRGAVVTGAASGIGQAVVRSLARESVRVAMVGGFLSGVIIDISGELYPGPERARRTR
jgi:NAD(P)-dependent dehydrogenase (short-subunit alcohol dehydrogenase family)